MTGRPDDSPPCLGLTLVRHLARPDRRLEAEGDLMELWRIRRAAGRPDARRAFWRDGASLILRRHPRTTARTATPSPPLGARGLSTMLHDLRYAVRLIRRQPLFAALVVTTLTLGIATSTAVFTICDRVLLRPLSYPSPDRIVALDRVPFDFANEQMRVSRAVASLLEFTGVGLYASGGLNLGDAANPVRLRATAASAGFFDVLGVPARDGRTYTAEEDRAKADVVVVSDGAWRRVFGGRQDLVGREIRLNSRAFLVLGVMPPVFTFPSDTDVWIPPFTDTQITGDAFGPSVIARLRPGVSPNQARAALDRVNRENAAQTPGRDLTAAGVVHLQDRLTGPARPTLLLLVAVAGLLLLAMCANVAGLLLARWRARERELHVRSALGAGRLRLVAQLIVESLVLSAAGALAGSALAVWTVRLFAASTAAMTFDAPLGSIDGRFIALAIAVATGCGLLFSVGPALVTSRATAAGAVRSVTVSTPRARRIQRGLVAAQVAVALVLLTTASAAIGVVARLTRVDLGFHNDRSLAFDLTLAQSRYPTSASIIAVVDRIETRLRAVPGVEQVGTTSLTPGSALMGIGVALGLAGAPPVTTGAQPAFAMLLSASPDYFRAAGIPLMAGRVFDPDDRTGSPRVVVLSDSAARALGLAPADAIRRRFHTKLFGNHDIEADIIGVAADVRLRGLSAQATPQVYMPIAQQPPFGTIGIVVTTHQDPAVLTAAVRAAMAEIDSDLPPYNVQLIRDLRARYLVNQRLTLGLTGGFAAMGLVLFGIGLYGVLAQGVAQRTREIGIRMALGANRARLRGAVIGSGVWLAGLGIAAGVAGAGLTARIIGRFVPALDAPSATAVAFDAAVLLGVAFLAAWIPACRASSVDPLVALRTE